MIDVRKTIESNIAHKFKMLSLQAVNDNSTIKDMTSLILIQDMIEWAGDLDDTTKKEALLVVLQNKLLQCYRNKLKICHYYGGDEVIYSNVNQTQNRYDWQEVRNKYLRPAGCNNLIAVGEVEQYDDCVVLLPFGQVVEYNPCDVIVEVILGETIE